MFDGVYQGSTTGGQSSYVRPATTIQHLASADGVTVQCCLPDGNVVFVPLNEIFKLFEKKMVEGIKHKGFRI
jgi:hypothetical protein